MRRSVINLCLLLACGAAASQTAKHRFGIDDMTFMPVVDASAVSPQGVILYQLFKGVATGEDDGEWHTVKVDGSAERKLDMPPHFEPQGFDADGDLIGKFEVNGTAEIGFFALDGLNAKSQPKRIAFVRTPHGFGQIVLSPDGSKIAVLADPVTPDPDSKYKTVVEPAQSSLFVLGVDGTGGKWWAPELHYVSQFAWNPDGKSIAVLSTTPKIGYHYVLSRIDVVTDSSARKLAEIKGGANEIAWAEGGKELAFLASTTLVINPDHVWTVPAQGGVAVDRTPNLKGSAIGLKGDSFGRVWVQVARGVYPEADLFEKGELKVVRAREMVPLVPATHGGRPPLVYEAGEPDSVTRIEVAGPEGVKTVASAGEDYLAKIDLPHKEVIHWTSKEGIPLEGIATFPAGFQKGHRYPFLVMPHGGPESNDFFSMDPFPRIFAGAGYVVIQPNYRGSTGYGSEFMDAIYQHFGDRAFRDVDSATDYAIEQGWADQNRLAIFGWSAGGFMTAWTISQTHRYRAAIEGAGITDWGSFIWTSDVEQIDYDARWPGKEPQYFHRFSAVDFADQVTTPLLILHGGADRRVPTYQGQEFFEALRANGKTVRMVVYPGSGHFPDAMEQQRDVFKEALAWLQKYNK